MQPVILHSENLDLTELQKFKSSVSVWEEVDLYSLQLEELFDVKHPELLGSARYEKAKSAFIVERKGAPDSLVGCWVYYPWNGKLVHTLSNPELKELRTNRNREIVSREEQDKLSKLCIGVCGLSVGGNMALSLAYSGIGSSFKLADFDEVSTTNLNRMLATLSDVGTRKIEVISRRMFEVDPFLDIEKYDEGLNETNLQQFFNGGNQPAMIFEEIDDFRMKIRLREEARKVGIPIVMLTCIGDRLLVDIERYDLDASTPLFNGLVDASVLERAKLHLTEEDKKQIALQIVDPQNLDQVVIESVQSINKTLVGRPQVMSTILTSAGIASYVARQIALEKSNVSGRTVIQFDKTFLPTPQFNLH